MIAWIYLSKAQKIIAYSVNKGCPYHDRNSRLPSSTGFSNSCLQSQAQPELWPTGTALNWSEPVPTRGSFCWRWRWSHCWWFLCIRWTVKYLGSLGDSSTFWMYVIFLKAIVYTIDMINSVTKLNFNHDKKDRTYTLDVNLHICHLLIEELY